MIAIPILAFLSIVYMRFRKGMYFSLLIVVSTKSLIDMYWDVKVGFLSIPAIQGVLLPFVFWAILKRLNQFPKFWAKTSLIYIFSLSIGLFSGILSHPVHALETLIINVNILVGFFLVPFLINDHQKLKMLLVAVMICGIFPVIVTLYQFDTGLVFSDRRTSGLLRYVGFYHDAFPVRFYGLMSLFAVLLYVNIERNTTILMKVFMFFLILGSLISIYLIYSKASYVIIVSWLLLIFIFSKKYKLTILLLSLVGFAFLYNGVIVLDDIETLFSKEMEFQSGELVDAKRTLAGRGFIWEYYLKFWNEEQVLLYQIFGDGIQRPTHNEYLRVLLLSGLLGLLGLLVFLLNLFIILFRANKAVRLFALMLFLMYLTDTTGLSPGTYYYYNILVMGFIGLLFLRPYLFSKT